MGLVVPLLEQIKTTNMFKYIGMVAIATSLMFTTASCTKKHCVTFTDVNGNDCCEKCFATQKGLDDFVASNTLNCPDVCD